jgi:Tfp pilus assembly protein PilN
MGRGVNLIPAPLLRQRTERRRARLGLHATALYLGLLLVAVFVLLAGRVPSTAHAAATDSALTAEQVTLLSQQVERAYADLAEARRRLKGSRVLSERPDWSALLHLVAAAAGQDVVLRGFSLQTTGPVIDAQATLRLSGVAKDPWTVSSFVLRLEESRLFDRVTIESSGREPYGQTIATAFALRCEMFAAPLDPATPRPESR